MILLISKFFISKYYVFYNRNPEPYNKKTFKPGKDFLLENEFTIFDELWKVHHWQG